MLDPSPSRTSPATRSRSSCLRVGRDFADIFAVKEHDFALGEPGSRAPLPQPAVPARRRPERVRPRRPGRRAGRNPGRALPSWGGRRRAVVPARARAARALGADVDVASEAERRLRRPRSRRAPLRRGARPRPGVARRVAAPRSRSSAPRGIRSSIRSRSRSPISRRCGCAAGTAVARLPAAGMPWFMTVFGRDTMITSLQTLLFGPELATRRARGARRAPGDRGRPSIDAEPGKIVHEVRQGKAAKAWFRRYYGTVDATPLYLVLLSEVWRWTGRRALVARPAGAPALEWIDRLRRPRRRRLRRVRAAERARSRQPVVEGLGRLPALCRRTVPAPIAPCEVQGYVYDAKRRAAELARTSGATGARRAARPGGGPPPERFDEAFWIDGRGGYYALALDADKRPVDSMCSNMGHLLWSGIVPPERVDQVVDALMGDALWSGWGVRTMSTADAAYNPLSYHNGTVWPHDNSLIAGASPVRALARGAPDRPADARGLGLLRPRAARGVRGLPRTETPFPIAYPTAARPQAWAAGTPVLLLQALLGLQPDRRLQTLETVAPAEVPPSWAGSLRPDGRARVRPRLGRAPRGRPRASRGAA